MATQEYAIAEKGNAILEFANGQPNDVPALRFRVSSYILAEVSPLFAQIFSGPLPSSDCPPELLPEMPPSPTILRRDGTEIKLYKMPQLELNSHDALAILLNAAHLRHQKVPREIDFETFVSVADVCVRYRCTSPLELQVEYQWLPEWLHMLGDKNSDGFLLISYAFGLRRIFSRMSKTIILTARDEASIKSRHEWPQSVRNKILAVRAAKLLQLREYCVRVTREYLASPTPERISQSKIIMPRRFTMSTRCPKKSQLCDASNLGWLMLFFNRLQIFPDTLQPQLSSNLTEMPQRSLEELCDCLRLFTAPPGGHGGVCDFGPAFRRGIDDIFNGVSGLTLRDVTGLNGWALSKHAGPTESRYDDLSRELPREHPVLTVPKKQSLTLTVEIALQILLRIDEPDDIFAAAMINKTFFEASKQLVDPSSAIDRYRQSTYLKLIGAWDLADRRLPQGISNQVDTQVVLRTCSQAEEESRETVPELTGSTPAMPSSLPRTETDVFELERSEKFLASDMLRDQGKISSESSEKHLREEQDHELRQIP
ncbi:hypothetical protein BP6252_11598 [Coleophoma cylindrospora]|uniref:BTB domain-containing protein n=1 Tax=Coleophoma cylindrospora TaxID=1849047 RepID=A0A3D8QK28_9HELO|nr:hypothetical protein BP6252_11598 [Coleophoma cylindrospora]